MATPFSPFVRRPTKPVLKRRQSQLPSDLIDWDAPEIPELDKQRIIYEDHIREISEDFEIETLLSEQIFQVAHDSILDESKSKIKKLEDDVTKERSRVNLLLGQIKMFETNVIESNERIDELETEMTNQRSTITGLEQEKEGWLKERNVLETEVANQRITITGLENEKDGWLEERNGLQTEIEDLNFRINETTCESNHKQEMYMQKKNEADEFKRNLDNLRNRLNYYKSLAKNKINDDLE